MPDTTYVLGYMPVFDRHGEVTCTRLSLAALTGANAQELSHLADEPSKQPKRLPGLVLKAFPTGGKATGVVCIRDLQTLEALLPNAASTPPAHLMLGLHVGMLATPAGLEWCTTERLGREGLINRLVAQGLVAPLHWHPDVGSVARDTNPLHLGAAPGASSGHRLDRWHALEQPNGLDADSYVQFGRLARTIGGRRGALRWRGPSASSLAALRTIQLERGEQPQAADAAFGGLPTEPWAAGCISSQCSTPPAANSSIGALIELMGQIDRNAHPTEMEATLQRESGLAYRLLAYLNSAAFGLPVEVTSFRHAVLLLGRARLKRWLALGLTTANADSSLRPLTWAALRRAFLMEELALAQNQQAVDAEAIPPVNREQLELLFVCGLFSLLDHLLQKPLHELMSAIACPPSLMEALLQHQGPLMPYLRAAIAVEQLELSANTNGGDAPTSPIHSQTTAAPAITRLRGALDSLSLQVSHLNTATANALARAAQLG